MFSSPFFQKDVRARPGQIERERETEIDIFRVDDDNRTLPARNLKIPSHQLNCYKRCCFFFLSNFPLVVRKLNDTNTLTFLRFEKCKRAAASLLRWGMTPPTGNIHLVGFSNVIKKKFFFRVENRLKITRTKRELELKTARERERKRPPLIHLPSDVIQLTAAVESTNPNL